MLIRIRAAALAALLIAGTMGASTLHAQTAAPQKEDEEVRWTLPPPSHLSTAPAPVQAAPPGEAPSPFGSAPVSRMAPQPPVAPEPAPAPAFVPAPAPPEAPSLLAPSVTLPMAMQPPAGAPVPVVAAPQPAPVAAPTVPAAAPTPKSSGNKPGAKAQVAQTKPAAKPEAKPETKTKAKTAGKPRDGKTAQSPKKPPAAAKPVAQTRPPEPVPPPPAMTEKDPEDGRIPVLSTVMDGVTSVGKTIGGLFD